jgi:hypothetical protein
MYKATGIALILLALVAPVQFAKAQSLQSPDERSRYGAGGVYRYVDLGERFVSVGIYGSVRFPGLYEVPVGTDVNTLMSMAGGAQLPWDRRQQDTRTVYFKLFREGPSGESDLFYEYQMEDVLSSIPNDIELQGGDVITVDSVLEQGFIWRDYLPLASVGISAILLIVQLAR